MFMISAWRSIIAVKTTRKLDQDYGLLVGISSGANIWVAIRLTKKK